jgi:hypothetical protein
MQQPLPFIPTLRGSAHRRSEKYGWLTTAMLMASLATLPLSRSQAATLAFTFQSSANASAFGVPSSATPSLPTTVDGSAVFVPFGNAIYTEAGTVTFAALPIGGFAPASTMNTFTFSFDGGTNTFSGTNNTVFGPPNSAGFPTFTNTYSILGGTGIFNGATGFASANGISNRAPGAIGSSPVTPVTAIGSGQITTATLTAVPEPGSMALIGLGVTGVLILRMRRRSE